MTPETNHDVEISIYHDFLEDQGIIVDRDPEEQDQWVTEGKPYPVGGGWLSSIGWICEIGGGVGDVVGDVGGFVNMSERIGG